MIPDELIPGEAAVAAFLVTVQKFCVLIDDSDQAKPFRFLREVHLSLAELYGRFLHLPRPDFTLSHVHLSPELEKTKADLQAQVFKRLQQKIGADGPYRFPVGTEPAEIELLDCDLAEDLAIIYCHLKPAFIDWHGKIGDEARQLHYYRWWGGYWTYLGQLILRSLLRLHQLFADCLHRPMYEGWQYVGGEWR